MWYSGWSITLTWAVYVALLILFIKGAKMLDMKTLLDEVQSEIEKEQLSKAKDQLRKIKRDIRNAEQVVANLKRQEQDLLIAISEGTN